ncbi:carboxymuconolactone decarboxylase family protein [Billgrantia kenyensis]|uniref:Carboxymuconolactone decarboxylase family protein n=1 Tax=Billgrantia kenyensis TaxID=321266 RepID=A0A7V9W4T5_9GAMM|nr:carboxymuconolactone decarboxylase family protein [Halomonas kenyensis]MBA2781083.1 carboxymuconolactone decarboxylase family protein [Halomonas kenyensis]MCG6663796.1 carboxymuconolactone decarboxylase family protein [Halomonas kenyensis]
MRTNYFSASPAGLKAMLDLQSYVHQAEEAGELGNGLLALVYTRVSQINGCAYCIDMHTKDARKAGETEQRLYALSAWRETPFYTPRERAALAWAEANTLIAGNGIDEALHEATREHFSEKGMTDLTLAVCAINAWNRLAISFAAEAGSYQP